MMLCDVYSTKFSNIYIKVEEGTDPPLEAEIQYGPLKKLDISPTRASTAEEAAIRERGYAVTEAFIDSPPTLGQP